MLARARVPVCVYVIGNLPGLTWLAVAPSWQGLAGRLARWDRVLDTADDLSGVGWGRECVQMELGKILWSPPLAQNMKNLKTP